MEVKAIPTKSPLVGLEFEITREKASALGRLGRQLEAALSALEAYDETRGGLSANHDRAAREALVAEAAQALWYFVVQREVCGLRDSACVRRDYGVGWEVWIRMGPLPAKR
jgi:hypothetical protein